MIARSNIRAVLLRSCAPTALALAALAMPQSVQAQAFGATPTVAQGTVNIDRTVTSVDTITVDGTDAVIDWAPIFGSGGPEIFLPNGNSAHYLGAPGATTFAVLNRILSTGLDPAVFEGLVDAFLTDVQGAPTTPGGLVAFYSPTGILVGPTGRFEVPQLVLTSHTVDVASFTAFADGTGPLLLSGLDGPSIVINDGALITGAAEGSYFVVAAPSITMDGTASINGSTVYVASNAVELTHSSGLFNITITTGTQSRAAITHTGTTGGPSSTGAGDEHVIYAVARTGVGALPANMLFSGNLGFEPAGAAGVVNGDIILSANYDVSGRTVDGGVNRLGANSVFDGRDPVDYVPLTLDINFLNATSNLLAIGTHVTSVSGNNDFSSDLVLVGRELALVNSTADTSIDIGGDLFVSASNYRNRDPQGPSSDATGGFASVHAEPDSRIDVAGQTRVTADGIADATAASGTIGAGTGGQAQILADGGLISLTGNVRMSANALTDRTGGFAGSGNMVAGRAEFYAANGGTLEASSNLFINANAFSPELFMTSAQPGADASGGQVLIGVGSNGGTTTVTGDTLAEASGLAGGSAALSGTGGTGFGGVVTVSAIDGGTMSFGGTAVPGGSVELISVGNGGNMAGGTGGLGGAGQIEVSVLNSNAAFGGDLTLGGGATGGTGTDGGAADGSDGGVRVFVDGGSATVAGNLLLGMTLFGADSSGTGTGGDATGGSASISLFNGAGLTVDGDTGIAVRAFAGQSSLGQAGDALSGGGLIEVRGLSIADLHNATIVTSATGGATDDGTGGEGQAGGVLFQIDPGSSAEVVGTLFLLADGVGGAVLSTGGGTGGLGAGGTAVIDVAGTASELHVTGETQLYASGFGGFESNGIGGNTALVASAGSNIRLDGDTLLFASGESGAASGTPATGFGGAALVDVIDAAITFGGALTLSTPGIGTSGGVGGQGEGGNSVVRLSNSTITLTGLGTIAADASGGGATSDTGDAGDGFAGEARLTLIANSTFTANGPNVLLNALGAGGEAVDGQAGTGNGGTAQVDAANGSIADIAGMLAMQAVGQGGGVTGSGRSGDSFGGLARLLGNSGADVSLGSLLVQTLATSFPGTTGGNSFGGIAEINLDTATLTSGAAEVFAGATSLNGDAQGGSFSLLAGNTSTAQFTSLDISANATSDGDNALAGSARIETLADTVSIVSTVSASTLNIELSAKGLAEQAVAGNFLLRARSGEIRSDTATIAALGGDPGPTASQIAAQGGDIRIADLLDVDVSGNLLLASSNGSRLIGAVGSANPAAVFDLNVSGVLELSGNDATNPGFIALTMRLASGDIAITPLALASAQTIELTSLNTVDQAVLGGTVSENGYTLTQAEANQLSASTIAFFLPDTLSNAADVQVRDLTFASTTNSPYREVSIETPGSMEVAGRLVLSNAINENTMRLLAGDFLQLTLPLGSVSITNANGGIANSTGLTLDSPRLIAANAQLAALIRGNPLDPTIPAALASDSGGTVASSYIQAAGVLLNASDFILMQNTGANGVLGGITVGDGGLSIENSNAAALALRVIAYGARVDANGNITNDAFFDEVIAGAALVGPFTDDATLNDCIINDGNCSPPLPPEILVQITNHVPIVGPLEPDDAAISAASEDLFFGVDFPSLVDLPLISEEGVVGDPVTSGTDSAANASDEDEDEDDAN